VHFLDHLGERDEELIVHLAVVWQRMPEYKFMCRRRWPPGPLDVDLGVALGNIIYIRQQLVAACFVTGEASPNPTRGESAHMALTIEFTNDLFRLTTVYGRILLAHVQCSSCPTVMLKDDGE
jgi:hypothetical protein